MRRAGNLKFADINTALNYGIFDVYVNGNLIQSQFRPLTFAGFNTAINLSATAAVLGGQTPIQLQPNGGGAFINAIEIVRTRY